MKPTRDSEMENKMRKRAKARCETTTALIAFSKHARARGISVEATATDSLGMSHKAKVKERAHDDNAWIVNIACTRSVRHNIEVRVDATGPEVEFSRETIPGGTVRWDKYRAENDERFTRMKTVIVNVE